jgi:hypothetical protein
VNPAFFVFGVVIQSLERTESVFNATIFKINRGKRFRVMDDDNYLIATSISSVH